jgi:hypothetical protein
MADDIAKFYPGQNNISDQFKDGPNLNNALTAYKAIKDNGGDYEFGQLTAKYWTLDPTENGHWKDSIDQYYPVDVQNEIKRHIIHALTHTDDHGHEKPIPISISWGDPAGPKTITCTYKHSTSHPSYEIVISGFRKPLSTDFAGRRRKY